MLAIVLGVGDYLFEIDGSRSIDLDGPPGDAWKMTQLLVQTYERGASAGLVEPAHALIDYVVSPRHDAPGDRQETNR